MSHFISLLTEGGNTFNRILILPLIAKATIDTLKRLGQTEIRCDFRRYDGVKTGVMCNKIALESLLVMS